MSNKSDFLRAAELNASVGGVAYSPPATVYVGASTTLGHSDGTGFTEPLLANGYARVAISTTGGFTAAALVGVIMQSANVADVNFPQNATAPWGSILDIPIYDAPTAGNLLYFGPPTTPISVTTLDFFKIPAGQLTVGIN